MCYGVDAATAALFRPNNMTTQREMGQRVSFACAFLERDVRVASIATMLATKFQISRSTAYEVITKAQQEIDVSDHGPSAEESFQPVDQDSLMAQLAHLTDVAAADNNFQAVSQMVKAMDQVNRWSGYRLSS